MVIDKNCILDYFQQYVFGFIFSDIENCIKARANFSVASLLMTYTEHMGALIHGDLGLTGKSKNDFNYFLGYMEFQGNDEYYKKFLIKYKDDQEGEKEIVVSEAKKPSKESIKEDILPGKEHNNGLFDLLNDNGNSLKQRGA